MGNSCGRKKESQEEGNDLRGQEGDKGTVLLSPPSSPSSSKKYRRCGHLLVAGAIPKIVENHI